MVRRGRTRTDPVRSRYRRDVARPTPAEIDADIVETAAALFATHGFDHTSLQQVADAVGYSKTGLLHRFPSKDALLRAAAAATFAAIAAVADDVAALPAGPGGTPGPSPACPGSPSAVPAGSAWRAGWPGR